MPKVTDADKDVIEARLANGESLRSIAQSYGVAYQTLQTYRRKWGLPTLRPARTSGEDHKSWRGGSYTDQWGYKMVVARERGGINPYVAEHILIAEKTLDRRLTKAEVVHHINGDKTDNRPENLLVCNRSQHRILHRQLESIGYELIARGLVAYEDGAYRLLL